MSQMVALTMRVPLQLVVWLETAAKAQNCPASALARTLLEDAAARARYAQEVARDADD